MAKTRAAIALVVAVVMTASVAFAAVAQDEASGPEANDWLLTEYTVDGSLVSVPDGVEATLLLQDGEATGNGGCNSFSGSYQIDEQSITFGENFARTAMFCEGDPQAVDDAYLATLPMTRTWSIEDGVLRLHDAAATPVLVFGSTVTRGAQSDLALVLAALLRLQSQLADVEGRLDALEGDDGSATDGDGAAAPKVKKPKAPRARGGKVQLVAPDYMRDEFRPESERSDEKNRETVRWRKGSNDADGYRVYARRGFCALKPGADPEQELAETDFKAKRGPVVQIAEVGAATKRYRPDHEAIDQALAAAPESPYSADQFYDLLVAAYNSKGESKRTLVASYMITPEFRCP